MERRQCSTKSKARVKDSPRGSEKKTTPSPAQQAKAKPPTTLQKPGVKQGGASPRQPTYTPKRVKGGPVFKQLHIRFRYSDAVSSFAHQLLAEVGPNPQVRVPPAPPAPRDSLPVDLHHPEKLDFERVFTKIVPVKVDNGRLCITPKPGLGEGQRTQFVFSVMSHHAEVGVGQEEGAHLPLGGPAARSASCPPPKHLPTSPRPSPGQCGVLQTPSGRKVCFSLPSIGQGQAGELTAVGEVPEVRGPTTQTKASTKVPESDLAPSRTRPPMSKLTKLRIRVKLPPISKKTLACPALPLPATTAQAVT